MLVIKARKKADYESSISKLTKNYLQSRKSFIRHALFLLFCTFFFMFGYVLHARKETFNVVQIHSLLPTWGQIAHKLNIIDLDTEHIDLHISYKNFQLLSFKRNKALERGKILVEEDSYVPVKVEHNNTILHGKIRLKGGALDHVREDSWSYRIKLDGASNLFGLKRFSVQRPETRGNLSEWGFYQYLLHEKLIALKYDFITLAVNGKKKAIYALEESFSKELLERNERRESVILKFDESLYVNKAKTTGGDALSQSDQFFSAPITSFSTPRVMKTPHLEQHLQQGKLLLTKFRSGKIKARDAFNIEKSARLFAAIDLFSATHAIRWKNIRFYYNPLEQKLELIAYDAFGEGSKQIPHIDNLLYHGWKDHFLHKYSVHEWLDLFFSDQAFVTHYFQELKRLTAPGYLENFLRAITPSLIKKQKLLSIHDPNYSFNIEQLLSNRDKIKSFLSSRLDPNVYLSLQDTSKKLYRVSVENRSFIPLELKSINCSTEKGTTTVTLPSNSVEGKTTGLPLDLSLITDELKLPEECHRSAKNRHSSEHFYADMSVTYSLVTGEQRNASLRYDSPSYASNPSISSQYHTFANQLYFHKALLTPKSERVISYGPGNVYLSELIVIPAGFQVKIKAGTKIYFDNNAALISYSPFHATGTSAEPIEFIGSGPGNGLAILSTDAESIIQNTRFINMYPPLTESLSYTGSVTFYEADVRMQDCTFSHNIAEDALNIVRSELSLKNIKFMSCESDCLDIDFSKGKIREITIKKSKNDGIDLSGSKVSITNANISDANDKAISVGEASRVTIHNSKVLDAFSCIASKDNSILDIEQLALKNCTVGLTSYVKKPEYGPGRINGNKVKFENVSHLALVDEYSDIVLSDYPDLLAKQDPTLLDQIKYGN